MSEDAKPARKTFAMRLAIGLLQGLAVFALAEWSRQAEGKVEPKLAHDVLWVLALVVPPSLLGAVGRLSVRSTLLWLAGAVLVSGGLTAYQSGQSLRPTDEPIWMAAALAPPLFVAFQLMCAGLAERRWRASYPRYFDGAWLDGVRLVFAFAFTGAMWAVLALAAQLFALIGIKAVGDLIRETVFAAPATTLAFAAGVHLTDVRVGLVRGVRTVGLTLLGWLAPLMGLVALAFLAALPFTGLKPLWDTGAAAGLLLSAAAALIILLNAVYQDGEDEDHPPKALRWAGRAVALAVLPLVLIAGYAVSLRIGQYGLTPERVLAGAALILGVVYGAGYAWAAVTPGRWLARLEGTNILAAWLGVGVGLALLSPVADPRRLSVADQIGRLERGEIKPAAFDYALLASGAGRYGRDALAQIAKGSAGEDAATRAKIATAHPALPVPKIPPTTMESAMAPIGKAQPPPGFFDFAVGQEELLVCAVKGACRSHTVDLGGTPTPEVIVFRHQDAAPSFYGLRSDRWRHLGYLESKFCLGPGGVRRPPESVEVAPDDGWRDVIVDGLRIRAIPQEACPEVSSTAPTAPSAPPQKPPPPALRTAPRP